MGTEFNSVPIFIGKIDMDKNLLIHAIIERLSHDHQVLLNAARTAHLAATDPENTPDNKYETLALESSYLAQGQANRAQELKLAVTLYRNLNVRQFTDTDPVFLTALIVVESRSGNRRVLFLGPAAGGLTVVCSGVEVVVITPGSPLGKDLLGKERGDSIEIEVDGCLIDYELIGLD